MTARPGTRRQQSGIALLMLLSTLILAASYAFYRTVNSGTSHIQQDAKLTLSLAQAKEALIAYAVIDDKRPGRMPCPDIIGDGISPFLTRDDCSGWTSGKADVYAGGLPWKTLDLAQPTDDHGTPFHYVSSRFFAGDRSASTTNSKGEHIGPELNSKTGTSLAVDIPPGSPSNDIVAIIIATRGALDARNADGDAYYFSGTAKTTDDNDVIAVITRQELMAAVEKRIVNEVRNCLEQHAAALSENPAQTYPWPAPLSNSIFKGKAGSLFGMVPTTQPGGNPDAALKQSISDLDNAKNGLATGLTASEQLAALEKIQELAAYARALFDRIYIAAIDLLAKATAKNSADSSQSIFATLDTTLAASNKSAASFNADASKIPATINSALPGLAALRESLANSGFDIFLVELETQNNLLKTKIDSASTAPSQKSLGALQTQANTIKSKLLSNSFTPNPTLAKLLNTGFELASSALNNAQTAKNAPDNPALVENAISSAMSLYNANIFLYQTIQNSRLNIDPDEIGYSSTSTKQTLNAFSQNPNPESTLNLAAALGRANTLVASIATASSGVTTARTTTLNALESALTAVNAPQLNSAAIQSSSSAATNQLAALALTMKNNGDNIAQETLKNAYEKLSAGAQTPPATRAAGQALGDLSADVVYWAELTADYATEITQKARKPPGAINDSENSAYSAARKLLYSLDGSTGSIELLNKYIKDPGNPDKFRAAQSALSTTQSLLSPLKSKTSTLENLLEAGLADATLPTQWHSNACSALKPPISSNNWWLANKWAELIFYQLSDRVRPATGKLVVNRENSLKYRIIVLSAGAPLGTQNREQRKVSNFLEGDNAALPTSPPGAESTRDGDATAPINTFMGGAVSSQFNDRLAYCDSRLGPETCK